MQPRDHNLQGLARAGLLYQRLGSSHPIALGIIDAKGPELRHHGSIFDKLRNGLDPHHMSDLVDGIDYGVIDRSSNIPRTKLPSILR